MGTGRRFKQHHLTRPSKSPSARRRRQLEQKRRLIGLGVDEAKVEKMTTKAIRDQLRHPAKVQAALS